MTTRPPEALVRAYFLKAEEGGRTEPTVGDVARGIASIDGENFDAFLFTRGLGPIQPGQTIVAPIGFLCPEFVLPLLSEGKKFHLFGITKFADVEVLQVFDGASFVRGVRP